MNKEIINRYTYHAPNPEQIKKYNRLREIFLETAVEIDELCPESPELNEALRHLDVCLMMCNASIARNTEAGE